MLGNELSGIFREVDHAEQSHVFKGQIRAIPELEDDARKSRRLRRVGVVRKIAGHAEVEMQPRAAGISEEVFAMAAGRFEPPALQRPDKRVLAYLPEHTFVADIHAGDLLPQRMRGKVARENLYLGQLGQATRSLTVYDGVYRTTIGFFTHPHRPLDGAGASFARMNRCAGSASTTSAFGKATVRAVFVADGAGTTGAFLKELWVRAAQACASTNG
jgi:hypothetical protein